MNIVELEKGNNDQQGKLFVDTLRQINKMERKGIPRRHRRNAAHIDIDVSPIKIPHVKPELKNRDQAEDRLVRIIRNVDATKADGEYLAAHAHATLAYLQALKNPHRFSLADYTEATLGTKLERIPQKQIEAQFQTVDDLLRQIGGFRLTAEGWRQFVEKHRLDPDSIPEKFNQTRLKILPKILETLGLPELKFNYRVEYIKVDKPWVNWASVKRAETSDNKMDFLLRVNTHPRVASRLIEGSDEMLPIHEIGCHFVQAEIIRRNINRRNGINPGYGVMTIPGPEQFGAEGMAIASISLFSLRDTLSDFGLLAFEKRYLDLMVYNNIHVQINNETLPPENEVKQRVMHYLPSETEKSVENALRERRDDLKYRSYHGAYEGGAHYLRQAADRLLERERRFLVRELFDHPMTPNQIDTLVRNITAQRFYKAS